MKTILFTLVLGIVIGGYIGWGVKPEKDCPEVEPNTLIEYRYIDKIDTVFIPKHYTQKDTVIVSQLDTFYVETKYIAEADTTYQDSSLSFNVKYVSDIPLSDKSFFDMRFKVREKTVTNTVIQTEKVGFWYKRFIPYFGIGLSYNGTTVEPAVQIGFGVRIN